MVKANKIYIFCTLFCNLSCTHCIVNAGPNREEFISDGILQKSLKKIDLSQVQEIHITGGEPFLYKNLANLILMCRKVAPASELVLATNGTIPPKGLSSVINSCVDRILISLDGNKKDHDTVRGEGSFGKLIQNLEELISLRCKTQINMVDFPHNRAYQKKLGERLVRLGVNSFNVMNYRPYGRARNLSVNAVDKFIVYDKNEVAQNEKCMNCTAKGGVAIFPDGSLSHCPVSWHENRRFNNIENRLFISD